MKGLWVLLLFAGCVTSSMDDYARAIGKGARPGPKIRGLIKKQKGNPLQVFLKSYRQIYKNFRYLAEPPGQDVVQSAESTLSKKPYRGDCEDFCVMVMALSNGLGLRSRIGLGKSSLGPHAMAEVLITQEKVKGSFLKMFKREVGILPSFHRDKWGVWLEVEGFPPRKYAPDFQVEYYVYPGGKLEVVGAVRK